MKRTAKAFTLIELLTVIGIIALLLAIAMPAYNEVRIRAKEMKVKATINAVSSGLEMFKNDMGSFPDSDQRLSSTGDYSMLNRDSTPGTIKQIVNGSGMDIGAHRLAEALFGLDMLGYQKNHEYYISPATNPTGTIQIGQPVDYTGTNVVKRSMYIDTDNLNIGRMSEIERPQDFVENWDQAAWDNPNPVILDDLSSNNNMNRPFLYYRSHERAFDINSIYYYSDNMSVTNYSDMYAADYTSPGAGDMKSFRNYIWDPKTGGLTAPKARPHQYDGFIIITAGRDGLYGTEDDICNFDQNAGK